MWHAAASLDYQLVLQIIGAFEGLSLWQGFRLFKGGGKEPVDFGISDPIDAEVRVRCAAMQKSDPENLEREINSLFWLLKRRRLRMFASNCWLRTCAFFWDSMRLLHRALVFLLRVTPFITIPCISLSYILQWGCTGQDFKGGEIVWWFIATKCICFLICWGLASMLHWHVNVKTPASDDGKSIVPEPKKGSVSTAKRKAKRKR